MSQLFRNAYFWKAPDFHNPGNDGKIGGKQKKLVIDTRD
jgi:hypothetical protein